MTRPHGGQSGRHVRTRGDDQRLDRHPQRGCRPGHGRQPGREPSGRVPVRHGGASGTATRSSSCVDPRFNRTAAVADRFVQIRAGTDIAFLGGLIHYALDARTATTTSTSGCSPTRSFLVKRAATPSTRRAACSRAGTTSGRRTPTSRAGATSSTSDGFAKVDPTLQHPRSVFQVMKTFYARYTPEMVVDDLRLQRRTTS